MPPDKPQPTDQNDDSESSAGLLAPIIGLILVIGIAFVFLRSQQRGFPPPPQPDNQPDPQLTAAYSGDFSTMGDRDNIHSPTNILSFWWGAIPDALRQISAKHQVR